jgi:2-C-methyl-D-erythritol 4-phosphate cytidylyltransferase
MNFTSKRNKIRPGQFPLCAAVIAAAGHSARMAGEDKLFADLCGAPVLAHTLLAFQNCGYISEIIVVVRSDRLEYAAALCEQYRITKAAQVVAGGETRLLSVMNGLFAISDAAQLAAIHDGARPCVDEPLIARTIEEAAKHHAAAPAIPVSSTIKRAKEGVIVETVARDGLYEIQTPQVFYADLIKAALTNAKNKFPDITDDCKAVEILGMPVRITQGSRSNIKITTREDLKIAEGIIKNARLLCQAISGSDTDMTRIG